MSCAHPRLLKDGGMEMRGGKWALGLVILLVGRGILPQSREMEELKLVNTLAVDGGEKIVVTGVTGVRAGENEEPEVLTGEGESLAGACKALRESSARRAYLGQTEQLLVGDEGELMETLGFVVEHRELRMDTLLYIVKGSAGDGLAASAQRVAGETGGQDARGRTVGEILPRLAQGEYALAPALAAGEEGLEPAGWAALGPEGVVGYYEGDAELGAGLLAGSGQEQVVELAGGVAELMKVKTWAKGGTVFCTLTARVVQGRPGEEELAAWGEGVLRAALGPGWDCWGLDREQGAMEPWNWDDWKGEPVAKMDVKVTGRLVGS